MKKQAAEEGLVKNMSNPHKSKGLTIHIYFCIPTFEWTFSFRMSSKYKIPLVKSYKIISYCFLFYIIEL